MHELNRKLLKKIIKKRKKSERKNNKARVAKPGLELVSFACLDVFTL